MPPISLPEIKKSGDSAWVHYWDQDTLWAQSKLWELNARLFFKKTESILNFSKNDQLLDIGCGSGHAAELIAPITGSFLGADTSGNLLALARERCRHLPQASFIQIPEQDADFSRLGKFSLILCVSVIQYYPNLESVVDMVRSVSKAALPGGRMLIADIPQPRNFYQSAKDFLVSLAQSFKEGYAAAYLATLMHLPFSHYHKFSKQNPILEIPVETLKDRISELGFKTTIIHETVSLCARPSLLIQF